MDFYGDMYSHIRSEYTIFFYRKMWLNYIKKINLVKRLMADEKNHFFFITNRLEHLHFAAACADKISANTIFFERAAQFSFKLGPSDADYIMGEKMGNLGVKNFMTAADYKHAASKIFITIANNSPKDKLLFKSLTGHRAELDFLTFTPADTNSHCVSACIPLFGNNDSPQAWNFYMNVFNRSAIYKRASRLLNRTTRS